MFNCQQNNLNVFSVLSTQATDRHRTTSIACFTVLSLGAAVVWGMVILGSESFVAIGNPKICCLRVRFFF